MARSSKAGTVIRTVETPRTFRHTESGSRSGATTPDAGEF
jgi:hypothetical protein